MLKTPKNHFKEDTGRARALVEHARTLPAGTLRDDILRGAWMMAVGACDAYFSDAYADLVSRTLRAKELQTAVDIPDRLNNLKIPVTAILRQAAGGWKWRMAARELIEDENVLSLEKIRNLFNHFFEKGCKIIHLDTIENWITHRSAISRLFGMTGTQYRAKCRAREKRIKQNAVDHFEEHYKKIFQRRHDCIHNCDRPKIALQTVGDNEVIKRIVDIEFLVARCHEEFLVKFPAYLSELGFDGVTRNQVCA